VIPWKGRVFSLYFRAVILAASVQKHRTMINLSGLFLLTFFCLCSDAVSRVHFSDAATTISLLKIGTSCCISYYTAGNSSRIFVTSISDQPVNYFSTARYICLRMVVQIPWRVVSSSLLRYLGSLVSISMLGMFWCWELEFVLPILS
jgi:hypothetical protein